LGSQASFDRLAAVSGASGGDIFEQMRGAILIKLFGSVWRSGTSLCMQCLGSVRRSRWRFEFAEQLPGRDIHSTWCDTRWTIALALRADFDPWAVNLIFGRLKNNEWVVDGARAEFTKG